MIFVWWYYPCIVVCSWITISHNPRKSSDAVVSVYSVFQHERVYLERTTNFELTGFVEHWLVLSPTSSQATRSDPISP